MFIKLLLIKVIDIYIILIVIRAVISWFSPDPYNPLYQWLIRLTEPVLGRLRNLIPMRGIDFSPFIVIIVLNFLRSFIAGGTF
jgi:YggT family protein